MEMKAAWKRCRCTKENDFSRVQREGWAMTGAPAVDSFELSIKTASCTRPDTDAI